MRKERTARETIAKGLGAIQRIDYNWSEMKVYSDTDLGVAGGMMLYAEAAPLSMDIEPEDINVSDTATVVWAIE